MEELRTNRYHSTAEIDAGEWDSIVDPHELFNTHAYLTAIEHSRVNDLRYAYFTFSVGSRVVAHASVVIFVFGLEIMIQGLMAGFVERVKKIFPRFLRVKVIECGHPTTLGSSVVIDKSSGVDPSVLLKQLDKELVKLAKEEKTSLIDVRDVYSSRLGEFDHLKANGYKILPNMANTFFRIYQRTFAEYMDDLTSKRRYEIRRRMELFREEGCTIEKVVDFGHLADELAALWRNTFDHATEYQREVLNSAYFENLSEALGDDSFVLLCRKEDTLIGFTMLISSGETLISTYCGLDYLFNRSTYSYFVLFYRSIEEAIALGKDWLELGLTNYNPKIEVGAMPEPMYIYAKSTRRLLNLILAPVLRALDVSPDYNKRRVFNNRFYERHPIAGSMRVNLDGVDHACVDLSQEGIRLQCSGPPIKKGIIRIDLSDGHAILMSGTLKNSERVNDGTWRAGYQVRPKSPDHVPLWHNLVARYSVRSTG